MSVLFGCCCPSAPAVTPSNPVMMYDDTAGQTPLTLNLVPAYPLLAAMAYGRTGIGGAYTWDIVNATWTIYLQPQSAQVMTYDSTLGDPNAQHITPANTAIAAVIYDIGGGGPTFSWNTSTLAWV